MSDGDEKAVGADDKQEGHGNGKAEAMDETRLELTAEGELELLKKRLDEQTQETEKFKDLYTRERAEQENYKRRMQRDKIDTLRFATEPLVRDLLPVVDNLERAVEHTEGNETSVVTGVKLVLKSLLDVLERHGVKRIEATGQVFDPNQHQAIATVESAEHEPNQVVAQHQAGYMLHDRLLRPAMVTVNGRKSTASVASE